MPVKHKTEQRKKTKKKMEKLLNVVWLTSKNYFNAKTTYFGFQRKIQHPNKFVTKMGDKHVYLV